MPRRTAPTRRQRRRHIAIQARRAASNLRLLLIRARRPNYQVEVPEENEQAIEQAIAMLEHWATRLQGPEDRDPDHGVG
jgi:hypothetical protein